MIVNFEDLPSIRTNHQDERIVLAGGCFDIVHEGHVLGMEYCKSNGDILVVGISSDERVRQRKGEGRPYRHQAGRIAVVNALKPVDYTFIMPMPTEQTPTIQAIIMLRPNVFMDHIENYDRWEPSRQQIETLGTELIFNTTPRLDSTTEIISRIQTVEINKQN
jgi:D-beta-D-heptose 7-phosphate kinase/D-beta-D-heptose 1-phosphate adenosyltransferase